MTHLDAAELAAIVRKTVGRKRFEGLVATAGKVYDTIRNSGPSSDLFALPWSELDDERRMVFVGFVAPIYSQGFEDGVES